MSEETAADRLRLTLQLHDFGVAVYRQRMARDHPERNAVQVEAAVDEWLSDPEPAPGTPRAR